MYTNTSYITIDLYIIGQDSQVFLSEKEDKN